MNKFPAIHLGEANNIPEDNDAGVKSQSQRLTKKTARIKKKLKTLAKEVNIDNNNCQYVFLDL